MIPIVAFVTLRVYRRTQIRQDALGASWENLSTELHEILNNVLPIKIFSGEQRALQQIERRSEDVAARQIAIDKVWGALGATNGLLRLCARLAVIGVGVYFISIGETTFGIVTTFLGMLNQLLSPFDYLLADVLRRARRTQSAFARLQNDWKEENRIVDTPNAKRLNTVRGEVEFRRASYRYHGKTRMHWGHYADDSCRNKPRACWPIRGNQHS
jgi:ABC-type multidrug transport system fused ATPase/permease subunit